MTQTHTPGPWLIRAGGDVRDFTTFPAEIYSEADADELGGCAAICTIPDDKRQKANARLIAAAPDMEAALLEWKVASDAQAHAGMNGNNSAMLEATLKMKAAEQKRDTAIAKARGQS